MTPPTFVLVVALGLIGGSMLVAPGKEKQVIGLFTRRWPVRLFGVVLVVFSFWTSLVWKSGVAEMLQTLEAVLALLWGGVALLLPDTVIVTTEDWRSRSDRAHRIAGAVFLILAVLLWRAVS